MTYKQVFRLQKQILELPFKVFSVLLPCLFAFKVFVVSQIESLSLYLLKLADYFDLRLALALKEEGRPLSLFELLG